jgi:hypothetical protein
MGCTFEMGLIAIDGGLEYEINVGFGFGFEEDSFPLLYIFYFLFSEIPFYYIFLAFDDDNLFPSDESFAI